MNRLLKVCFLLSLFISTFACTQSGPSDRAQIEAIVAENLLDPESVRFGDFVISETGNRACIEYNAKNRFGGYAGQSIAEFRKPYDTWTIENLEAHPFSCSTTGFEISDAEDAAELEAINIMASAFHKAKNLSELDAVELAKDGEITIDGKEIDCSSSVSFYKIYMKSIANDNVLQQDSTKNKVKAKALLDYLNKGECPSFDDIAYGNILEATDAGAAAEPKSGEEIYNGSCMACHATGAAGAPKVGDAAAWAPRIAQGEDTLLANATNGLRVMPPKGACATCTEDDLKAAIEYMVSQSQRK